jgi:tetratricopeptide (TPR) repeat protein
VNPEVQSQLLSALGDAHHQLAQYAKSDSCFDAALKLFPNDAGTLNNYAYYLSLRKDKLELAAQMSKRSLELQPGSQSFLDTYGWILFQQGKYPDALKYIQQAVNSGDADAVLLEHLGDVYFKLNQVDEALKSWKMSAEKAAPNPTLQRKINEKNWYE